MYKHEETYKRAHGNRLVPFYVQTSTAEIPQHRQQFERYVVAFATELHNPWNETVPLFTVLQQNNRFCMRAQSRTYHCCFRKALCRGNVDAYFLKRSSQQVLTVTSVALKAESSNSFTQSSDGGTKRIPKGYSDDNKLGEAEEQVLHFLFESFYLRHKR